MNDDNNSDDSDQPEINSGDPSASVPPPFGTDSTSKSADDSSRSNQPPSNSNSVPSYPNPEIIPPPPMPSFQNQAPAQGTYYSNTQGFNVSGPQNDAYAITALSTGVLAIVLECGISFVGIILGIVATVFGFLSLGRIDRSQGQLSGKGMAIAGLICGIIGIVIGVVIILYGLAMNF